MQEYVAVIGVREKIAAIHPTGAEMLEKRQNKLFNAFFEWNLPTPPTLMPTPETGQSFKLLNLDVYSS